MVEKSRSRFSSELTKISQTFEKSLRNKTALEIRVYARLVYTTAQFEEFKRKYTKEEYLIAYASKVAEIIEQRVKINDIAKKKDLFSKIISDPGVGLNKAFDSFNPDKLICNICREEVTDDCYEKDGRKFHKVDDGELISDKLVCKVCGKSSAEILNNGNYRDENGKRIHITDDGELVCKSFNSWVVDHIQYPTKNTDKEADKRAQYKEYACPQCGKFILEKTRQEDEQLVCEYCSEDGKAFYFNKSEATKQKKSYYNTEMSYLSQPIGNGDDESLTLNNILYDKDDSEELFLRSRLKDTISKIKMAIATKWPRQKTGIFKNPEQEAQMFDYFVPSEFLYSEEDIQNMSEQEFEQKIKKADKATGLMIAERAGYTFPYAICLDCGLKIILGNVGSDPKNPKYLEKWEALKKQGCPNRFAEEHQIGSPPSGYDRDKAIADSDYQYRVGYERAITSGSNAGKVVNFEETSNTVSLSLNYDERRLQGSNLELRDHKSVFSDIGDAKDLNLPTNYKGEKEHITIYMHQVANRWMGKLRKDCPKCRAELAELEIMVVGRGQMTCPECGYTWDLREGDFLKRVKTDVNTKDLFKQFLSVLRELLILRHENSVSFVSIGKIGK